MKKRNIGASLSLCLAVLCAGCGTMTPATTQAEETSASEENVTSTSGTSVSEPETGNTVIHLSNNSATINGSSVEEYDYTWHISPDQETEWYEGDEPDTTAAAYISHDIWYYPTLDESAFTLETYDGETEWVYHYTADGLTDYIFGTLPVLGDALPTEMMHSSEEAYANPVLHITKPGTYELDGEWHGQIMVDLGDSDDTYTDENARVTLILNGVDITCDCAPGILFYRAYECDNAWEEASQHSGIVDTSDAGANIEIADGSVNNVTGANIYRLLKAEYKNEDTTVQKKAHKIDGAFYSFVSMNIDGGDAGVLNITSTTYEGLDSELHLTINGGFVNIYSQDDAINVNEDDVSVFTMNDGILHIFSGLGAEGDGIDSNGYITVNDGTIAGGTPSGADSLLDADCEITENGGKVITIGSNQMGGPGMAENMTPPDGEMPNGMAPPEGGEMPADMTPPDKPELP